MLPPEVSPPPRPPLPPFLYGLLEFNWKTAIGTFCIIILVLSVTIHVLDYLCRGWHSSRSADVDDDVERGSSTEQPDHSPLRLVNLPKSHQQVVPYDPKRDRATECAICLRDFKEGERCRVLVLCNHIFHKCCVNAWLRVSPSCPVCRAIGL